MSSDQDTIWAPEQGQAASAPRLGATWDGRGVHFRLFSRHAEGVELCLFSEQGEELARHPMARHPMARHRNDGLEDATWETYRADAGPGQLYGYRVHGPWNPATGDYFNPAKLLADPYALALTGEPIFDQALLGHASGDPSRPDNHDSAPYAPKCRVVDRHFDWGDDRSPRIPWNETLIYECHVRGMTRRHPDLPEDHRGTYLGLASEPIIEHLRSLGVTTIELLPVHQIASEPHLARQGRTNYFGYSPLGFMAPHAGYAQPGRAGEAPQVVEFKRMVKRFHRAGLEVLLDVVFNHTAEGNSRGPLLSLRGIDNRSYYRLDPADPSRYLDLTGCGNTLDLRSDVALELVIDALAYWVDEMHVDGFRFDLAPALAREESFDPNGRFLSRLREHPTLARVKLIAEPWDLGRDGYQLGQFPAPWREWNDRYRDAARNFWRGRSGSAAAMHRALAGSPEIFAPPRPGLSSIDFVACHDGFTLEDLVSYDHKHNEANGESNRDGRDQNLSRNWGTEGVTEDEAVLALRRRAKRNFLTTLALSGGVPMLAHGDELGRTQLGNNNAYCQDSELTWVDWSLDEERHDLLEFARRAFALRRELDLTAAPTVLSADGSLVDDLKRRRLPLFGLWRPGPNGGLLILLNGTDRPRLFRLPHPPPGEGSSRPIQNAVWLLRLASFPSTGGLEDRRPIRRETVRLPEHSAMVLQQARP